jgi:tetratricopeptide (TPR) repeat protein
MIRFVFIAWLLLSVSSAGAQTVLSVNTGEHGAFTRAVIRLPESTSWELDQNGTSARLTIRGADVSFNVSRSFRRINRNRIKDLSQSRPGAPLEIELGCRCVIETAEERSRYLVLDVREGSPISTTDTIRLPLLTTQAYRFAFSENVQKQPEEAVSDSQPGPETAEFEPAGTSFNGDLALPLLSTTSKPDLVTLPLAKNLQQTALFERLVAQRLERASRQGLVMQNRAEKPENGSLVVKNEQETSPEPRQTNPESPADQELGIAVITAIDRDLQALSRESQALEQPKQRQCPKAFGFLETAAAEQPDFTTVISALRVDLVTELDAVRDEVLRDLAQAYLAYGFGAEAAHALSLTKSSDRNDDLLRAAADLVDDRHVLSNPFHDLRSCDDGLAFWDFLAQPDDRTDIDSDAIVRGFLSLPLELRENLGPKVAEGLLENGKKGPAASVVRATRRVQENLSPNLMMAEASVARESGDRATSQTVLEEVIETGSEQSPRALIELVEQKLVDRKGVPESDVGLLEAYGNEYRDTELLIPLQRARVLGLALNGDFDAAVDQFGRSDALLRSDRFSESRLDLFALVLERGSDFDFARFGTLIMQQPPGSLPADLSRNAAKRFLELGLASSAQSALVAAPSSTADEADRILEARIHLELRLPHQAMISLLGIASAEADFLRAEAMALKSDFGAAAPVYENSGATKDAAKAYYLAGELEAVDQVEDGGETMYTELANAEQRLNALGNLVTEDGSLSAARGLLNQTEETRRQIDTLLSASN